MAAYLAAHAIGLIVIFLLFCIVLGTLAMHIANKETGRAWQKVALNSQKQTEDMLQALETEQVQRELMRKTVDAFLKNQAGVIDAFHQIAKQRTGTPLLPAPDEREKT